MTSEQHAPAWLDRSAYPFHSRFCAVPGGRLHYVDEGEGEPIVFAHGTPTWSFEWRHLVGALSTEARCIAPDHLGFGLSDRPRGADYTPEAHAARFGAFVDALELSRFTLVVHDFGGPIALPTAISQPERIRRLVIINSWMWPFELDPTMHELARMAGSWWTRPLYRYLNASLRMLAPGAYGDRSKLTPAIHRQYLAPFREPWTRVEVLWTLARALEASRAHYAALWDERARLAATPALVIWGMRDSAFKPPMLELWAEALPHARTVHIPSAGHWPHEEAPDEVLAALRDWLRRERPRTSASS